MEMNKTKRAVALVDQGKPPHAAAVEIGIRPSAVYVALAKRKMIPCPCCGSLVKPEAVSYPTNHQATVLSVSEPTDAALAERRRIIQGLEKTIRDTEGPEKRVYFQAVVDWLKSV